jgi:hypothetical protein
VYELKPLSREAIPAALQKAERYRLLNEPEDAESICLDVLAIDPDHQGALVTLLLALTDQFDTDPETGMQRAREVLPKLRGEYERAYYEGLICERRAKAQIRSGIPGARFAAYAWFREAMRWYEEAEPMRPAGNDSPVIRWNTCARILARSQGLEPAPESAFEPSLEE